MTRGKYGAKASNRLARLDNELLQEKVQEISARDSEIRELKAELARRESELASEVLRRAADLSGKEIELANSRAAEIERARNRQNVDTAVWVCGYVHLVDQATDGKAPFPPRFEEVISELVGPDRYGDLVQVALGGRISSDRATRRLTAKKAQERRAASELGSEASWIDGVARGAKYR